MIEYPHRVAYEHGKDPIDHTVQFLGVHIEVRDQFASGLIKPGIGNSVGLLDQGPEAHARRLIGHLLDAGWAPPDTGPVIAAHDAASCIYCQDDA